MRQEVRLWQEVCMQEGIRVWMRLGEVGRRSEDASVAAGRREKESGPAWRGGSGLGRSDVGRSAELGVADLGHGVGDAGGAKCAERAPVADEDEGRLSAVASEAAPRLSGSITYSLP